MHILDVDFKDRARMCIANAAIFEFYTVTYTDRTLDLMYKLGTGILDSLTDLI
jgi:hypothetical protein